MNQFLTCTCPHCGSPVKAIPLSSNSFCSQCDEVVEVDDEVRGCGVCDGLVYVADGAPYTCTCPDAPATN